jgi:hypothetical protein
MRRDFRHFELPGPLARRYRPVRVHPHEKGLVAFLLDEYGLRFFRIMATGSAIPQEAVWSLVRPPVELAALHLVSGRREDALGYVVCEVAHASGHPAAFPVPARLSYRAKVTIAALQALLSDLADDPAGSATADVIGFIEQPDRSAQDLSPVRQGIHSAVIPVPSHSAFSLPPS